MTPVGEILLGLMERGTSAGTSLPQLLCEDASRTLPIMGVGITLMDADGLIVRAASSDAVSERLEELQVSLGEGPALSAFGSGRLVLVPDFATLDPGRWPAYTPAAQDEGVRAVMAYPLRIGGIHLGVLSLYRAVPGVLEGHDLARALHYADAAVLILLHLQSLADDHGRPEGLRVPINGSDRGVESPVEVAFPGQPEVHQATGMVSAQVEVGLREALLLLRAHAFSEGVPIAEVARAVVDRTLSFNHRW